MTVYGFVDAKKAKELDDKLDQMHKDHDKKKKDRKNKKIRHERHKQKYVNNKTVHIWHKIVHRYGPPDKWPDEVINNFPGGKKAAKVIEDEEEEKTKFGPHSVNPPRTKPPKDLWQDIKDREYQNKTKLDKDMVPKDKADWNYGWEMEKKWLIGKAIGAKNSDVDTDFYYYSD